MSDEVGDVLMPPGCDYTPDRFCGPFVGGEPDCFAVDGSTIVRHFREGKGNIGIPDAVHTAFPTLQGVTQDAMDQQTMVQYPTPPTTIVTSHPMNPPAGTMTGKRGKTAAAPSMSAPAYPLPDVIKGPAIPGSES